MPSIARTLVLPPRNKASVERGSPLSDKAYTLSFIGQVPPSLSTLCCSRTVFFGRPSRSVSQARRTSGMPRRLTQACAQRFSLRPEARSSAATRSFQSARSEEHTSELQSQFHLVCRLLL